MQLHLNLLLLFILSLLLRLLLASDNDQCNLQLLASHDDQCNNGDDALPLNSLLQSDDPRRQSGLHAAVADVPAVSMSENARLYLPTAADHDPGATTPNSVWDTLNDHPQNGLDVAVADIAGARIVQPTLNGDRLNVTVDDVGGARTAPQAMIHLPSAEAHDIASAVRDWAGLKSTHAHLLHALSFQGRVEGSKVLQDLLFNHSLKSPPFRSIGSEIVAGFTVHHVQRIDAHPKDVIQIDAKLKLQRHMLRPSPEEIQLVEVKGLLDVEIREFSAFACFSVSHSKQNHKAQDCNIEMRWKYPESRSLLTPFVLGIIKSSRDTSDPLYFHPMQLNAMFQGHYGYSQIQHSKRFCDHPSNAAILQNMEGLVYRGSNVCSKLPAYSSLFLTSGRNCNCNHCGPPFLGIKGHLMAMQVMNCDDKNGHIMNGFLYLDFLDHDSQNPVGKKVLALEGSWCPIAGLLSMMACYRAKNSSDDRDCSINVKIQFALRVSSPRKSILLGSISSLRNKSDPDYFTPKSFEGPLGTIKHVVKDHAQPLALELNFNDSRYHPFLYCVKKIAGEGRTALEGEFPRTVDSGFLVRFKSYYQNRYAYVDMVSHDTPEVLSNNLTVSEIDFCINRYGRVDDRQTPFSGYPQFSGQGLYNWRSGKLCLLGCKEVDILSERDIKNQNDSCYILLEMQYPPGDPALPKKPQPLSGTISSLLRKSDPLYFQPMEFTQESDFGLLIEAKIWRIDLILRILILSAMAIIATAQLLHSKAHPQTLPCLSLTMLLILMLNHLLHIFITPMPNFSRTHPISPLLVTKLAIWILHIGLVYLYLCLLHLAWWAQRSRLGILLMRELDVLKIYLSLGIVGALGACSFYIPFFVYTSFTTGFTQKLGWSMVQAVAHPKFIVDAFLLPQVIANFVWKTKKKALSPVFYVGMTCLRSVPCLLKAYAYVIPSRLFRFMHPFLPWDIFMAWEGVALAIAIYVQQKWGGRYIMPS